MTEANKNDEVNVAPETDQKVLKETDEDRLAKIEAFYKENYGLGIPDMSLSLTENGLGEALSDLLFKYNLIPEGKELKSFVLPVNFGPEKTLPLVIWLDDQDPQLELPLDVPQVNKKYLN